MGKNKILPTVLQDHRKQEKKLSQKLIVQNTEKELRNFKFELYSVFENLLLCKVACL